MTESNVHKCIGESLCDICEHRDYKVNRVTQVKKCHEKGNHHKDIRYIPKYSLPYNSRQYKSRNNWR
jgi:hypothetical protein